MTITIKNLLESSFVISVDKNRYGIFCDRFSKYGLNDPLPRLFEGFKLKNGIHKEQGFIKTKNLCNCFFTHIALIKMAQCLDMDYICVFEDDALPCKDIQFKLNKYLSNLPDNIDMLKLGWLTLLTESKRIDERFFFAKTFGSHAYIIFKRFYKKYLECAIDDISIDRSSMNIENENIMMTNELLFIQDDSTFKDTTLHNNSKFFNKLNNTNMLKDFEI